MKLTAPPPGTAAEPPPETPSADPASPAPPTPTVPYEKPPDRVASWPTWFGPADGVLAAALLVLAFLTASFAARHSDIWLHLAAGKRLAAGTYKLGIDPFSYTGADRTWVNHSWLFDLGASTLYSGDGFLLVFLKALAAAAAFGLILGIRRSGQPLWPWVLFGSLGVLASANLLTLRPIMASILLLALTLWLVFRLPSPRGSWRLPIAIGVTFALWSNLDGWFVLGPFALLLLLAGEFLKKQLSGDAPADPADTLGNLPDVATLGKALVVGAAACMINPHHVGVWELPFELIGAEGARLDPRVRVILTSPLKNFSLYWQSEALGFNVGGFAYALLLLVGIYQAFFVALNARAGSAFQEDCLPLPLLLLWVGFAILSLWTMFAIPFFAIVSIPLIGSRRNALVGLMIFTLPLIALIMFFFYARKNEVFKSYTDLGMNNEPRSRILLTASSAGRLATILALILLGFAAWPGWLHAPASAWWEAGLAHPANTRRVEWRVEIDPDMRQSAEWLESARAAGQLSPETRGFAGSTDFANYCAYFAPSEKVFANSRFAFHAPELAEFAKARRGLGAFSDKAEPPDIREAEEVFTKWKAAYVVIAWQKSDGGSLLSIQEVLMWLNLDVWSPWFFNGRSAITGWRQTNSPGDPSFNRLRLDPAILAFGPEVQRLAPHTSEQPYVQASMWDEFFSDRRPTPTGVEESSSWLTYKMCLQKQHEIRMQTEALLRLNVPGLAAPVIPQAMFLGVDEVRAFNRQLRFPPPADGSFQTYPILALRAARRAIAENPNHPDGYYALALALGDRDLPIGEGERAVSLAAAYQQCLARLPKPSEFRRNFFATPPAQVAEEYAMLLLGRRLGPTDFEGHRVDMGVIGAFAGAGLVYRLPASPATMNKALILRVPQEAVQQLPQGSTQLAAGLRILPLDIALQLLATAEEYARVEYSDAERRASETKRIGEMRKTVDAAHKGALDKYRRGVEKPGTTAPGRQQLAMMEGLIGEAMNQLNSPDLAKDYGNRFEAALLHFVALQLAVGQLEQAAATLEALKEHVAGIAAKSGASEAVKQLQQSLSELEFQKYVLEGNYAEAGKELEAQQGTAIGLEPLLVAIAKENVDPKQYKNADAVGRHLGALNVSWPLIPMLGIPVFGPGEPLSVLTAYVAGRAQLEHFERLARARQLIMNKLQRDSEFFFRRGFLSLLEGDIAAAKTRFQSANRKAPPGWDVPDVRHVNAESFLKQIEAGNKPKTP